jgi:hypothetical protein
MVLNSNVANIYDFTSHKVSDDGWKLNRKLLLALAVILYLKNPAPQIC